MLPALNSVRDPYGSSGLHTMRVLGNTFQLSRTPSRSSTSFQLSLRASRSIVLVRGDCAGVEVMIKVQVQSIRQVCATVTEYASERDYRKPTSAIQLCLDRCRVRDGEE
jgi:hypothetical protein